MMSEIFLAWLMTEVQDDYDVFYELHHEKTRFLPMQKQSCRPAVQ